MPYKSTPLFSYGSMKVPGELFHGLAARGARFETWDYNRLSGGIHDAYKVNSVVVGNSTGMQLFVSNIVPSMDFSVYVIHRKKSLVPLMEIPSAFLFEKKNLKFQWILGDWIRNFLYRCIFFFGEYIKYESFINKVLNNLRTTKQRKIKSKLVRMCLFPFSKKAKESVR